MANLQAYRRAQTAALIGLTISMTVISHPAWAEGDASQPRFEISFPTAVSREPLTGRLFVMLGRTNDPELRLQKYWFNAPQLIGMDVDRLKPEEIVVVDGRTPGYPFQTLKDVPPGKYYVQASLIVYREYPRADGCRVWAVDQWDGHRFNASPGNLYSAAQRVRLDVSESKIVRLSLTNSVAPLESPIDTQWVKHIKIKSELLSRFWGRPIYVGATVLLPRDYALGGDLQYPAVYVQQAHFNYLAPFDFSTEDSTEQKERYKRECRGVCETGYDFHRSWLADGFPQMIAVSLQHPTPYADFSAAINSANNGPYGNAIVKELIPYLERQFRVIRAPHARILVGKSLGGRDALALQLHHADFFGGAWIFYPWGISFNHYGTLNIYERNNAFEIETPESPLWNGFWSGVEWLPLERYFNRTADGQPLATMRQISRLDAVLASHSGGEFGAEDANFGPVNADGYPKPLWDRGTGKIDREAANHWLEHGDLTRYAEKHWATIGPQLIGKLHFYVGESDEYYRHRGVHHLEEFLAHANPRYHGSFEYAPNQGHGWQPMSNADLLKEIVDYIGETAPSGASMN